MVRDGNFIDAAIHRGNLAVTQAQSRNDAPQMEAFQDLRLKTLYPVFHIREIGGPAEGWKGGEKLFPTVCRNHQNAPGSARKRGAKRRLPCHRGSFGSVSVFPGIVFEIGVLNEDDIPLCFP